MLCARIFGTIKSRLRSLGKPTGEVDALIAAAAMAHEAILVTTNCGVRDESKYWVFRVQADT